MLTTKVIPAILTDTLRDFEGKVASVESFVDTIQIDYVDGYFAPEITCCEAKIIREVDILPQIEVHLMTEEPTDYIKDWYKAKASRLVGHIEEMEDQERFVTLTSKLGMEVGLALSIDTDLDDLDMTLVPSLNVVLLMAHEVGVQGAEFDDAVLDKIRTLRNRFPRLNIEVDGGINKETIVKAFEAGANYFAVGSDILDTDDPEAEYKALVDLVS